MCRFPESSSASEFFCNLVSGLDMVTADSEAARTWRPELYPDIPPRFGKLRAGELFSFDPSFFGVHGQQAKVQARSSWSRLYSSHACPICKATGLH